MIYLKSYEKYMRVPSGWEFYEIAELEDMDFEILKSKIAYFKSKFDNTELYASKFWQEVIPGHDVAIYTLGHRIMDENYKTYHKFEDLIKAIKEQIPKIEINTKKFNV